MIPLRIREVKQFNRVHRVSVRNGASGQDTWHTVEGFPTTVLSGDQFTGLSLEITRLHRGKLLDCVGRNMNKVEECYIFF